MTSFANRSTAQTPYYRGWPHAAAQVQRPVTDVRDDYERWYTESVPNNRMCLSLRSGIHSEVGWALDRLCRLCHNEQFLFKGIPGLIDGLFDWPEWYVTQGYKMVTEQRSLFSVPREEAQQRRFALESLFVLRNAALHEQNAWELARHSHTLPLVLNALHNLDAMHDKNAEVVLHVLEIFLVIASNLVVHPETHPKSNPIPPLYHILSQTSNRTLIIATLTALTAILSNAANSSHLSPDSEAFRSAIRYLPLFIDTPLIDACLNYLFVHVSNPVMARAFLLHLEMPNVLRILISLILHEQRQSEQKVVIDVSGDINMVPSATTITRDHDLTKAELDEILSKPEPQRCYDWMRMMFVTKTDGELTQVQFWNLYKDVFTPHIEQYPVLVASDVIKNVSSVFPQAQAMVLQGPTRFVVRGVGRRKEEVSSERFKCQWEHSQCAASAFSSPNDLFDHLVHHLESAETETSPCMWSSCPQGAIPTQDLRLHILTHMSSSQAPEKHPSQSDVITLPSSDSVHPSVDPTVRPLPPPPSTKIVYDMPAHDPPTASLTALLIIRILFRISFASAESAPRVDDDHFGFPGVVDDTDELEAETEESRRAGADQEAELRGRKAFIRSKRLMEAVQIRDDVLMGWVTEMTDAGMLGMG